MNSHSKIRKIGLLLFTAGLLSTGIPSAHAQIENMRPDLAKDVSLDQKLDSQIPLDTVFRDETGKEVKLATYFSNRPVVLVLPFYRCAGSCTLELDGMVSAFKKVNFDIGKEYDVLTVSIHPKETPEIASAKKAQYMDLYHRPGAEQGWHFLTGSWDSIQALCRSVGFKYIYDEKKDQIAHPAGIMILTPQGRVSRYFYGVNYSPKNLKLSLVEASQNRIGSLVDKVTLYCSAFDMVSGKYTPNIMRLLQIAGVGTALLVAIFITLLSLQNRRVALHKPIPAASSQTPTSV